VLKRIRPILLHAGLVSDHTGAYCLRSLHVHAVRSRPMHDLDSLEPSLFMDEPALSRSSSLSTPLYSSSTAKDDDRQVQSTTHCYYLCNSDKLCWLTCQQQAVLVTIAAARNCCCSMMTALSQTSSAEQTCEHKPLSHS
jgi:hypothetical protein